MYGCNIWSGSRQYQESAPREFSMRTPSNGPQKHQIAKAMPRQCEPSAIFWGKYCEPEKAMSSHGQKR